MADYGGIFQIVFDISQLGVNTLLPQIRMQSVTRLAKQENVAGPVPEISIRNVTCFWNKMRIKCRDIVTFGV